MELTIKDKDLYKFYNMDIDIYTSIEVLIQLKRINYKLYTNIKKNIIKIIELDLELFQISYLINNDHDLKLLYDYNNYFNLI